jgi:uncharacterized protein (UPF0276 family)
MPHAIANRWNLPDLGMGLGLRGKHIPAILNQKPKVGWFEVILDNALIHEGWLRHALDELAERYPLVLHGVTMNLGSTDPLDLAYLKGIKMLADRWRAPWISDHLCWTGIDGRQSHDLLPVPYSEEMLAWMTQRVRLVQDVLERPLVLENPSSYLQFHQTTMPEWEFLARLAEDADCALLLDVNNVYVAAKNHDFAWQDYLAALPWDRVVQMHVAGHTTFETHLFDSHIGPVDAPVWDVLRAAFAACGGRSLLLEWDFQIPGLTRTWREAQNAWARVADLDVKKPVHAPIQSRPHVQPSLPDAPQAAQLMRWMLDEVTGHPTGVPAETWIAKHGKLAPEDRVEIHRQMYALRCDEALAEDYPRLRKRLGKQRFAALAAAYRQDVPSTFWALERYGWQLPAWLLGRPRTPRAWVDLARLELARVQAHLAPESPPLNRQILNHLHGDDPERLVVHFAPATRIIAARPHGWLVSRRGWEIVERAISPLEVDLLQSLADGVALGAAMAIALNFDPDREAVMAAQFPQWLAAWLDMGAIARLELP